MNKMHEYLKRLNKALKLGLVDTGCFAHAFVGHDSWCGIHKGFECNCDPDITIKTQDGNIEVMRNGRLRDAARTQ